MLIPTIKKKKIPTKEVGIFVKRWNIKYPIDRWFRERNKIIWGSDTHRELTLLSIYFEYEENKLFSTLIEEEINKDKKKKVEYIPGRWYNLEGDELQTEESEELFDKIDIKNIKLDDEGNLEI